MITSAPGVASPVLLRYFTGADMNKNNSSVLADIPGLAYAISAAEVIRFRYRVYCYAGATPDIKFAVTAPAGATCVYSILDTNTAGTLAKQTAATATAISVGTAGASTFIDIEGVCLNGVTAGTVQLQFAQVTPTVENTTVYGASFMEIVSI